MSTDDSGKSIFASAVRVIRNEWDAAVTRNCSLHYEFEKALLELYSLSSSHGVQQTETAAVEPIPYELKSHTSEILMQLQDDWEKLHWNSSRVEDNLTKVQELVQELRLKQTMFQERTATDDGLEPLNVVSTLPSNGHTTDDSVQADDIETEYKPDVTVLRGIRDKQPEVRELRPFKDTTSNVIQGELMGNLLGTVTVIKKELQDDYGPGAGLKARCASEPRVKTRPTRSQGRVDSQQKENRSRLSRKSTGTVSESRRVKTGRRSTTDLSLIKLLGDECAVENIIRCQICAKEFKSAKTFQGHMQFVHTDDRPYKCAVCDKTFKQPQVLRVHERVHSDVQPYTCGMCDKTFKHNSSLQVHIQKHAGLTPHQCEICAKAFPIRAALTRHMVSHSDVKRYKCSVCLKEFRHSYSLTQHLRGHEGKKMYKCDYCPREFAQSSTLHRHVQAIHSGDKKFKCPICNRCFALSVGLKSHLVVHDSIRRFQCEVCHATFTRAVTLKMHSKIHTGERMFKCSQCPRSFTQPSSLYMHQKRHSSVRPHACSVCSKSFATRSELSVHMTKHSGVRKFQCPHCSKCYGYKKTLDIHINSHLGIKPLVCKFCPMTFLHPSSLYYHTRKHTATKPYQCKVCDTFFTQSSSLKRHQKIHVEVKPPE